MGFSVLGGKAFAPKFHCRPSLFKVCVVTKKHKSMIGNQDLLGLILFGYLFVVSPFGKEAKHAKVATALFILNDKFEFNDSSGCVPESAW